MSKWEKISKKQAIKILREHPELRYEFFCDAEVWSKDDVPVIRTFIQDDNDWQINKEAELDGNN